MDLIGALRELRNHGTDSIWWRKRFLSRIIARYYARRERDLTPITEREWDTLIVLDACRYDLFEEVLDVHSLPGGLSRRESLATGTPGFLAKNFGEGTFYDTVYVTGNPYVSTDLDPEQFHAIEEVWQDGWNDELGTVLPKTMRDRTLAAVEKFPNKRVISHFLQPHAPFVGNVRLQGQEKFAIRERALGNEDASRKLRTPFERLDAGEFSREQVWDAYRSNLECAFPVVEDLLSELEGLTAVTSDHGNALGERAKPFPVRVYGHPMGVHIEALTDVPWFTHENGERREVVPELPKQTGREVDQTTADRLRLLGYAE